jgi:hypothetical protein
MIDLENLKTLCKKCLLKIEEFTSTLSEEVSEYRFSIFIIFYLGFSMVGAHNISHLIALCYIIKLLENKK